MSWRGPGRNAARAVAVAVLTILPLAANAQSTGVNDIAGVSALAASTAVARATVRQSVVGTRLTITQDEVEHPLSGTLYYETFKDNPAFIKLIGEPEEPVRRTTVFESFDESHGLMSINQEVGSLNNQANVRAVTLGTAADQTQLQEIVVETRLVDNRITVTDIARDNSVMNSFDNATGLVGVNQSAGNLNQQSNVLALGIADNPQTLAPLNAITLDEQVANNQLTTVYQEDGLQRPRGDFVTDSFTNFRGIAQIGQASGDGNIARNALAMSVNVVPLQ